MQYERGKIHTHLDRSHVHHPAGAEFRKKKIKIKEKRGEKKKPICTL
jgi:hypothetical protein